MVFYRFFIEGIVQGVGFRPYIYRKATEFSLKGYVKNTGNGVEVVCNDKDFPSKLFGLPPLARIDKISSDTINVIKDFQTFNIIESSSANGDTELPADIFMCDDCLRELRDETDRRSKYYFITCTNCGPRFSMIEDYPYDRPLTAMKNFEMCKECEKEYTNPLNRRYHAQTIACKKCGPKLKLLEIEDSKKIDLTAESDYETIKKTAELIKKGNPVSIKGVGGFHLCSLANESSVKKVRDLLKRPNKPFALMVKNIKMAGKFADISKEEVQILKSPQRPIVVLKKKKNNSNKESSNNYYEVSELDSIGVMLPYTSLHYLLFDFIDEPLVMTSCNIPGEPINLTEKIGKFFLTHEREIVNRCDDSVIKVINGKKFFLRRSRGFTPLSVSLPSGVKDTICLGAEMNNAVSVSKNKKCYLSQYIGETSKLETFNFMKQAVMNFAKLSRLSPEIVVADLHPGYNSTIFGRELAKKSGIRFFQVQHHKAHIAGAAAEHNKKDYVGIAMDGMGYGEDGKIWGGEVFDVTNGNIFNRIGHLEEQPQIGGDSAAIKPKKMLFGILHRFLNKEKILELKIYEKKELQIYEKMMQEDFNVPKTTSAGRILDSAALFLGICDERTYDGRPAMLLESFATDPYVFEPVIEEKEGKKILMTTPLFRFLHENLSKDKKRLAATVQNYLAEGLFRIAEEKSKEKNLEKPIVFSGGVAYNRMISGFMINKGVLVNKDIPCGDGGICYGQAYLANLEK